jgi:tRNA threonylcarbamoyladenosine biosynthesis protein TsaB
VFAAPDSTPSPTTPLLAICSATERLAVAAGFGPDAASCWDGPGGPLASASLLPQINSAWQSLVGAPGAPDLGSTAVAWAAVAFGQGPGAFTGLRVACAVAQGLALGHACPVLPICSLMTVAQEAALQGAAPIGAEVEVLMDARLGEVYALLRPEALRQRWAHAGEPAIVAGSALAEGFTGGALPLPAATVTVRQEQQRARALWQLAWQAWVEGKAQPAAAAEPFYLRNKVALTSAERASPMGRSSSGPA